MQSIMKNGTLSFGGNGMERHTSENVKMFPARLPRVRHRNELTERDRRAGTKCSAQAGRALETH